MDGKGQSIAERWYIRVPWGSRVVMRFGNGAVPMFGFEMISQRHRGRLEERLIVLLDPFVLLRRLQIKFIFILIFNFFVPF